MYSNAHIFPGVYFETVKPAIDTVLPRMDIAVFVGFASSGPLHTPVAVEDMARFREIFGVDLDLAWNSKSRETEKSCLGSAVEIFFRNGGKRCWVVRVADESLAQTARFAIPGLYRTNGSILSQAYAEARSPGAWAEFVRLRSQINIRSIQIRSANSSEVTLQINSSGWYADVAVNEDLIQPGDLISLSMESAEATYYLYVERVSTIAGGMRISGTQGFFCFYNPATSPPMFDHSLSIETNIEGLQLFNLRDFDSLGLNLEWPYPVSPDESFLPIARLLKFQMRSIERGGNVKVVGNLSFHANHPRFWGNLPDDETLFTPTEGLPKVKVPVKTVALIAEANTPRFPICGTPDSENFLYLPLFMTLSDGTSSRAEFADEADKLLRNGLENFGSIHFVDPRLTDLGSETLMREANRLVYLAQTPTKLRGLHSALILKEATLIALPDAMHPRWDDTPPDYDLPLAAPTLFRVSAREEYEHNWRISWSAVAEARFYRVEWSSDPDFYSRTSIVVGSDDLSQIGEAVDLLPEPQTEYFLVLQPACPQEFYFRVRAEQEAQVSVWSNYRAVSIPAVEFTECSAVQAYTLELELSIGASVFSPTSSDNNYELSWNLLGSALEAPEIDEFEVQRADELGFYSPEILFRGSPLALEDANFPSWIVQSEAGTTSYFRVRAIYRKSIGPWSNTLTLWSSQLDRVTMRNDHGLSEDLLAIHRSVLRSCAARGDLFTVLSFPRRYQVQDVLDHCVALKPGGDVIGSSIANPFSARVRALSSAEEKVSTYAAFYFPWIAARVESSLEIRYLPPDGSVVGKIAHRALEQGAWIAPANSPFENLIALDKKVSREQWQQLMQARVNVIRRESRGHLLMSADTFSRDIELNEINVRRLMSMIRRIAESEGNRYVFENNNDLLHDKIKQQFDTIFARLFARGAFAGSTPDQAFRVITGPMVNTVQSIDAGRFIVELHVAPSRPLKFIRVRLVQEGSGQIQLQEFAA